MHRPFRFGVVSSHALSHSAWITTTRRVEELGYATLLVVDRIGMGLAPFTALAVAAEATTSLRVGTFVFCNDFRHPAVLAKEAATLDLLSEGRFELGLGAGVGPSDYNQMGIPFESAGTRVSRLEESLQIIKQLFTEEIVNFSGKYYTINGMRGVPRPVQQPHPPILLGSSGKRMLSIAARQADIITIMPGWDLQGADAVHKDIQQKIAWVQENAGERFAHLQFCQTIYNIQITDNQVPVSTPPGMPPMQILSMSTEQAVEHLLELRERYGYTYFQIYDGQIENFAPVVARLAGQ
jgi:probable F420-dependent oxidoreductase